MVGVAIPELPRSPSEPSKTGGAPLLPGLIAELHGQTVHAEVCKATLQHDGSSEDSPHPELNMNNPEAGTVLHWACAQRLREAAMALVNCRHFLLVNARLARDGSTALHVAAAEGLDDVVEALLARPDFAAASGVDRDGFTALHGAAFRGHHHCARLLLGNPRFAQAAGVAGAFDVARPFGHWAREAVMEYDMNTALHMAAAKNHANVCDAILRLAPTGFSGADATNRIGATALHIAARAGHTDCCLAILKHSEFKAVNVHDARGFTALHWAAQQACGDMCSAVLQQEEFVAINKKDLRGRTAMDIAQEKGHYEVMRLIYDRLGPEGLAALDARGPLTHGEVAVALEETREYAAAQRDKGLTA